MHELIKSSIAAHGGQTQWNRISRIAVSFKADGIAFKQRGQEGFTQNPLIVAVDTLRQHVVLDPFPGHGKIGVFEARAVAIESQYGELLEELKHPRESFAEMIPGTPWSSLQLAYFVGYGLWMYLTVPFSLLHDGVTCEEVDPWVEDGEMWRALKVTFPPSYVTHSSEQTLYFDATGLLRRHDYVVEISGGNRVAHYLYDHRTFDGIVFATRRRVYLRNEDGSPQKGLAIISADLSDFHLGFLADRS
jgi:hypothetical protein